MKQFIYNGKIITASSKKEAVKVIAKSIKLSDEEILNRAKDGDKLILKIKLEDLMSIKDNKGNTPIHYLASNEVKEVLKLPSKALLIKNNFSLTPVHIFAKGSCDTELYALPKELLTVKDDEGNTPIHYNAKLSNAISFDIEEFIKLPKQVLSVKNNDGNTPVHILASYRVEEILKLQKQLLIVKNNKGETPITILKRRGVKVPKDLLPSDSVQFSTRITIGGEDTEEAKHFLSGIKKFFSKDINSKEFKEYLKDENNGSSFSNVKISSMKVSTTYYDSEYNIVSKDKEYESESYELFVTGKIEGNQLSSVDIKDTIDSYLHSSGIVLSYEEVVEIVDFKFLK